MGFSSSPASPATRVSRASWAFRWATLSRTSSPSAASASSSTRSPTPSRWRRLARTTPRWTRRKIIAALVPWRLGNRAKGESRPSFSYSHACVHSFFLLLLHGPHHHHHHHLPLNDDALPTQVYSGLPEDNPRRAIAFLPPTDAGIRLRDAT